MKKLGTIIAEIKNPERPKNLYKEFQQYGVWLAETLDDTKHYSLYIKLAKDVDRTKIEEALTFTKGYLSAKNRAKVFMWRLKQLREEVKN